MSEMPYPENPGQTHWEGCWRSSGHHNCAVREVERVSGMLAAEEALSEALDQLLAAYMEDLGQPERDGVEMPAEIAALHDALQAATIARANLGEPATAQEGGQ